MVYLILICIAAPLLPLLLLLDRRSRLLVGSMMCGMLVAACAYELNTLFCALAGIDSATLSITFAPIAEEFLKALPILLFAMIVNDERKLLLQMSMAVGIGFAMLENAFLLINYMDAANIIWALLRGVSTSLSHGICTMIVGCRKNITVQVHYIHGC